MKSKSVVIAYCSRIGKFMLTIGVLCTFGISHKCASIKRQLLQLLSEKKKILAFSFPKLDKNIEMHLFFQRSYANVKGSFIYNEKLLNIFFKQ